MKKILIVVALVLTGVCAQAQSVWDGSRALWTRGTGSQDDPFLIESAAHLAYLSYMVGKGFNTSGLYFKLTTDIDLNGNEDQQWIPIGLLGDAYYEDGCERNAVPVCLADRTDLYFKGHFDGENHCIFNLYINKDRGVVGLFGMLGDSGDPENPTVVENLFLVSGYVKGLTSGGIAGKGTSRNCLISRCLNGAMIEGNTAGGIVGGTADRVYNCNNIGSVYGSSYVGGIVGETVNEIIECFNTGAISGQGIGGGLLGGGLAMRNVRLENCYNSGEVSVTGTMAPNNIPQSPVGGLVGIAWLGGNNALTNSYNSGTVTAEVVEPGALVGSFNGEVTNSYYLNTCGGAGEGEARTADEMRDPTFVEVLNNETDVWCADTLNSNDGFPILGANNLAVGEQTVAALQVYPNPSDGHFVVEGTGSLKVFDVLGQLVLALEIHERTALELPQGMYFIRLDSENDTKLAKLVVR